LCFRSSDLFGAQRHKQEDISQGIFGPEFAAFRHSQPSQQHKYRRAATPEPTASIASLNFFGLFSHDVGFDDDEPASQDTNSGDLELEQEQQQDQESFKPLLSEAADERDKDEREKEVSEQYAREEYEHRQQAAAEEEEAEFELERRLQEEQMQASEEDAGQEGERRQLTESEERMRAYESLARKEEERRRQIQAAEELEQPLGAYRRPRDVRRPVVADEWQRHVPEQPAMHDSRDEQSSEAEELRRAFNVDWSEPEPTKQKQALCWQ
jgi:hypothetical protein